MNVTVFFFEEGMNGPNLVRETSEGVDSQGVESDSHLALLWFTIGQ